MFLLNTRNLTVLNFFSQLNNIVITVYNFRYHWEFSIVCFYYTKTLKGWQVKTVPLYTEDCFFAGKVVNVINNRASTIFMDEQKTTILLFFEFYINTATRYKSSLFFKLFYILDIPCYAQCNGFTCIQSHVTNHIFQICERCTFPKGYWRIKRVLCWVKLVLCSQMGTLLLKLRKSKWSRYSSCSTSV